MKSKSQRNPNPHQSLRQDPVKLDHPQDRPKAAGDVPESPWARGESSASPTPSLMTNNPNTPLHKANAKLGPGPYRITDVDQSGRTPRSPFAGLKPLESTASAGNDNERLLRPLHQANAKLGPPPYSL